MLDITSRKLGLTMLISICSTVLLVTGYGTMQDWVEINKICIFSYSAANVLQKGAGGSTGR